MVDYLNGWSDENSVYLVHRKGEQVFARRVPARWSAFFLGMDESDRAAMRRSKDVVGLEHDGRYTRIDFRNFWARKDAVFRIGQVVRDHHALGNFDVDILEADVRPLRRLLSDDPTINVDPSPRLGFFDLEADSRRSFDDHRSGKTRLLSWAVCDASRQRLRSDVLSDDTDEAERAMLAAFFEEIGRYDVMLAWSGDSFDFPTLRNRALRLRVKVGGKAPVWQRWAWLDALEVYAKYNQAHESGEERASLKLDDVAQHVVGHGKDDFDSSKTWQAWAAGGEERARLLRYNEKDTLLLPEIEDKTGFIALHLAVCHVTRCFPSSDSLAAVEQGDGFLLRLGAERGHRFATKKRFDDGERPEGFAGAYVMEPRKKGLIRDVHVCDFAGLYPSIMRSWNMSPDTKAAPIDAREGRVEACKLPERNVYFRTEQRGIIPLALDQLVAQRAEYTKRADAADPGSEEWSKYKRLSGAFKIVANSFYGIVGSIFSRFYDKAVAEGVTQTGAWLIKRVAARCEADGLLAIYGDTDSVFVQGERDVFQRVVDDLNASWPALLEEQGCRESRVKLEFEKSFRSLVLVSAKRYAARYLTYKGKPAPADMKPEVKGLEFKRGDSLRIARQMQAEVIGILLRDEDTSVEELQEFVARWRDRILVGELSIEDIVVSQSVKPLNEYAEGYTTPTCRAKRGTGKYATPCGYAFPDGRSVDGPASCPRCGIARKMRPPPVHVRVAKMLQARGEQVTGGTRVEYLVVEAEDGEQTDDDKLIALPARDPGVFERIDRRYYWERKVFPATQRVLEAVYPDHRWDDRPKKEPAAVVPGAPRAGRKKKRDERTLTMFAEREDS